MSTLSQFTGGGDTILGEIVPFNARTKGFSFSVGSREFMQTGVLKPYSAEYAPLVATNTLCGVSIPTDPIHKDWSFLSWSNIWSQTSTHHGIKYFELGVDQASALPYKHLVVLGSNYAGAGSTWFKHHYGVNFANTVSASQDDDGGNITSVHKIGNRLVFAGYRSSMDTAANGCQMFWSTSSNSPTQNSAYTYQTPHQYGLVPAENPSSTYLWLTAELTRAQYQNNAHKTTDGLTFTTMSVTTDMRYPGRLTWSTAGNCWICITHEGKIYTSPDGLTWTLRTSPTGMPTSIGTNSAPFGSTAYRFCIDHPTQGTFIMLETSDSDNLYMLKTTNGTTFTLQNIAPGNPQLRNYFWGGSGYAPRLMADGNTFIMYNVSFTQNDTSGATIATSTDYGVTWTLHPLIFNNNPASNTRQAGAGAYVCFRGLEKIGSQWYGVFVPRNTYGDAGSKLYELTNRGGYFSGTPSHIGVTQGLTFASGSSLSPYIRIK